MSPADLIADLRRRGVALTPAGVRLRYRAPPGVLHREDLDCLREAKPVLMALLRAERDGCPIPTAPCHACRGRRYWFGGPGPIWACETCHPPGAPELVRTWHHVRAEDEDDHA